MDLEMVLCTDELIHTAHDWESHEPHPEEPDVWLPVVYWCEGRDDQDDPLFRFECCSHCGASSCPRRDGHASPCRSCKQGGVMLGEPGYCGLRVVA